MMEWIIFFNIGLWEHRFDLGDGTQLERAELGRFADVWLEAEVRVKNLTKVSGSGLDVGGQGTAGVFSEEGGMCGGKH